MRTQAEERTYGYRVHTVWMVLFSVLLWHDCYSYEPAPQSELAHTRGDLLQWEYFSDPGAYYALDLADHEFPFRVNRLALSVSGGEFERVLSRFGPVDLWVDPERQNPLLGRDFYRAYAVEIDGQTYLRYEAYVGDARKNRRDLAVVGGFICAFAIFLWFYPGKPEE